VGDVTPRQSPATTWQQRLITSLLYMTFGLIAALIAWLMLGRVFHPLVFRAIASCAIASAVIGLISLRWLVDATAKRAIMVGAIGGVLVHLVAWLIFVYWAWPAAWLDGRTPAGTLLGEFVGAMAWSLASVSYGFLITCPALAAAAWSTVRLIGPTPKDENGAVESVTDRETAEDAPNETQ
jgi:hypothetical protein